MDADAGQAERIEDVGNLLERSSEKSGAMERRAINAVQSIQPGLLVVLVGDVLAAPFSATEERSPGDMYRRGHPMLPATGRTAVIG
jgi:hypothetical protein